MRLYHDFEEFSTQSGLVENASVYIHLVPAFQKGEVFLWFLVIPIGHFPVSFRRHP